VGADPYIILNIVYNYINIILWMIAMKLISSLILFGFSLAANAADLPTVVEGSENYDNSMCVESFFDNCNSMVCTVSDDIDCQEKCQKEAEDKCAEIKE
jgi:hypothetical protein